MLSTSMMTIVGGEATKDVEDEAGDGQVFARYDRRLGSCEEALHWRIHQRLRRIHGKSKSLLHYQHSLFSWFSLLSLLYTIMYF